MEVGNLVTLLDSVSGMSDICEGLAPALKIVGVVYKGIQYAVPIILIIVGMIDFTKAVTEKSEDKIKEAQHKLIKKAIAAVCVFLVATIVGLLMRVVSNEGYKDCMTCVTGPFGDSCSKAIENANKSVNN